MEAMLVFPKKDKMCFFKQKSDRLQLPVSFMYILIKIHNKENDWIFEGLDGTGQFTLL